MVGTSLVRICGWIYRLPFYITKFIFPLSPRLFLSGIDWPSLWCMLTLPHMWYSGYQIVSHHLSLVSCLKRFLCWWILFGSSPAEFIPPFFIRHIIKGSPCSLVRTFKWTVSVILWVLQRNHMLLAHWEISIFWGWDIWLVFSSAGLIIFFLLAFPPLLLSFSTYCLGYYYPS